MNPYATGFNGYQAGNMPPEAYQLNAMNYFNQLQATFGISNMVTPMSGQPQIQMPPPGQPGQPAQPAQVQGQEKKSELIQQQNVQNMSSFALNPQYPPQQS